MRGLASIRVRSADAGELRTALEAKGVTAAPNGAGWLTVRGAALEAVGTTALEQGIAVFELFTERQSLEDVFLELTGDGETVP